MATRVISTKVAITGESEYRSKVAAINSTLKTLKSELALVESQNKGTANSMAALQAKCDALSRAQAAQAQKAAESAAGLQNAQKAQREYSHQVEQSASKLAGAQAKLEALKKSTSDTTALQQKLTAEVEKHKKALDTAQAGLNATNKAVGEWQRSTNYAQRDLNNLDEEVQRHKKYLDEAARSADGCASSIDGFGREVQDAGESAGEMGAGISALASILAAAGVAGGIQKITEALRACVDASLAFETAMAGVRRTVGGTDAELAALAGDFKAMALEIPSTTTELGRIAETAGQLGIQKDRVSEFTRVMAMLSTTTDLTAENAATMLAQFANITGLTDYERLGATVAELGDATATTASKVVEMSQGMAAAASIAGMSETDILAIAAAVGSLGIEAQAGSTAMSTLISNILKSVETGNDQLTQFASVAGMSAQDFAKAWRTDAAGALDAFIKGLNDTARNGKSAVVILDELGITNVRQTKAILGLANAGDLLTTTIAQANQAWEENTALQKKAGIMYATTESRLAMAKNAFDGLKAAVGDQLTPALGEAAELGKDAFSWAADFVEQNPALVQSIMAVVAGLGAFVGLTTGFTALVVVLKAVKAALAEVAVASTAIPIFGVIAAITALVTAIGLWAASMNQVTEGAQGLRNSLKETEKAIADVTAGIEKDTTARLANLDAIERLLPKIEALNKKNNRTSAEQAKLNALVETANSLYPGLIGEVDEFTGAYDLNVEAIERNIDALKRKAQADAYAAIAQEKYQEAAKLRMDAADKEMERDFLWEQVQEAQLQAIMAKSRGESEVYWRGQVNYFNAQIKALDDATEEVNEQIRKYEADADKAIDAAAELAEGFYLLEDSADNAADSISSVSTTVSAASSQFTALQSILDSVQGGYELLTRAQDEMTESGYLSLDTVKALLEQYPELYEYLLDAEGGYRLADGALQDYIATQRAEYQLALDGAEQAAQAVVNAEIQKRGAIVDTTQSIKDQIKALIAFYGAAVDAVSAMPSTDGGIEAQREEQRYLREVNRLKQALAEMEAAEEQINGFDRVTGTLARDNASRPSGAAKGSGSSKASKASKQEPTQAELDLKAYQKAVKELDHSRAMEEVTEADYYRRKGNLASLYLKENLEEHQKWEEELYAYQKGAYSRELKALDGRLADGEITTREHLDGLAALQTAYLTKGTDEWRANAALQEKDTQALYDHELNTLNYMRRVQVISEGEYFAKLAELRDRYLKEDSEAWRKHTAEIYEYEQKQQEAALKARQDAVSAAMTRQKAAEKARAALVEQYAKERIEAIKAEQKAEEARVDALIDGINEEIAARKRLRQEESDADAVARAQKTLNAARIQLAYARDADTRAELEKEVLRAEAALQAAVQSKEDNDWTYAKQQEIEALKEQLEAAKAGWQQQIDDAPRWAEERVAQEEEAEWEARAAMAQREAEALEKVLDGMKLLQQSAAGAVAAAARTAAQTPEQIRNFYSTNNHNSVSVTTAASPMTSGQLARAVEKIIDKLSR